MKRIVAILVVCVLAAGTIGCETVKGMGRDIGKAGDAIERAAE
jgi:predicted small secreted protein